jgi:hypothetical protein
VTTIAGRAAEFLSRLTSGMSRKDAARWKSARTMTDLGELVIAWLNGEITQTPGHCGPPDDETYPLIPALTVINRGGFVTDNSQLAESLNGETWNTWVDGFATAATLAKLRAAVAGTPLVLTACGRARHGSYHECGRNRFQLPPCPRGPVTDFWADRCPQAAGALWSAWWVRVEDPEPGRNDLLWTTLTEALGRP